MFKKLMCAIVAMAVTAPTFAAQDAYITFKNGKTAVYKNLPDSVDNAQFEQILRRDHGMGFNDVDPATSRIVEVPNAPVQTEAQTEFWDSTTGKVIKYTAVALLLYYGIKALPAVGKTCYTGPRGGTYTITKSGRHDYSGC